MTDGGIVTESLVASVRAPGVGYNACRPPEQAIDDGLFIDNFAGGGGASTGIEMALGRSPDVAINHDAEAVALHALNHPDTLHLCQNVWKADPIDVVREASARRCARLGIPFRMLPVRGLWFSPDCKHFSKAKGSKPVEKGIRDLAWVVVHWVKRLKQARVSVDQIWLENVEEFKDWGPLIMTEDGKRVPCPLSKGVTFKRWCRELRKLGGKVEHRELRAYQYGAPTIRKRLFVIVRFDGLPIVWPAPTHGRPEAEGSVPGGLLPWRTAAECIDWSIPCPSIFTRDKPLVENTLRRVARGVMRYVVNAERPYIVGVPHSPRRAAGPAAERRPESPRGAEDVRVVEPFVVGIDNQSNGARDAWPGGEPLRTTTVENRFAIVQPLVAPLTHQGGDRASLVNEPFKTVTAAHRGEMALIAPHVTKFRANSDGHAADEPMHTVTANSFVKRPGGAAPMGLVSAVLPARYGEREGQAPRARPVDEPMASVVPTQNGATLAGVSLAGAGGPSYGGKPTDVDRPMKTLTTENHAALVAAFLAQHNTGNDGHTAEEPVSTIVGKGCTQGVVAAHVVRQFGTSTGSEVDAPAGTVMTDGGGKVALAASALSERDLEGAQRVTAFLLKYYGVGCGSTMDDPMHSVTTRDRFGLVTVKGVPIVDIGLRMLTPRELYRAQGFPDSYIIDGPGPSGKPLTKTAQVRMCGNSVCPPVAAAIVAVNVVRLEDLGERAAD